MVDGATANAVAIGQLALRLVLRHIDNQLYLMIRYHLHHVLAAFLIGPGHGSGLHTVLVQETCRSVGGVDLIAVLHQVAGRLQQVHFALHTAAAHQDAVLRYAVTRGYHGVEQGLVQVVAQTTYLTGRRHVHTQHRVGILQTGEGEL